LNFRIWLHRHRRPRLRRLKPVYKIACLLLVSATAFFLLDAGVRPVVRTVAESSARNDAVQIISAAVSEIMETEGLSYDGLVTVETNAAGQVVAVKSDAIKMNRLKALISTHAAQKIGEIEKKQIQIPLGTFLGNELLSGRGPGIRIKYSLSGNVQTQIENRFEAAGINQTRHQVLLRVTANINIILPGGNASAVQTTDIILAETIVVGLVPDLYANTGGAGTLPAA
jgi:sporulation protein YunB